MEIIQPKVELWQQGEDKIAHVAKCARVCYGKQSGDDKALYANLNKKQHLSMFRHETYYSAIPVTSKDNLIYKSLYGLLYNPYIKYISYKGYCYIVTNGNFLRDIQNTNPVLFDLIYRFQIIPEEAKQIEPIWESFMRYTFCVVTQISTSRELNRVSPNNIAEQSTRYVYEDGTICCPYWLNEELIKQYEEEPIVDMVSTAYLDSCHDSFKRYEFIIANGMLKQDARGILPLDTATKCVYTYSIDEWRHIIKLRSDKRAHPNAQIIANMIKEELEQLGYNF